MRTIIRDDVVVPIIKCQGNGRVTPLNGISKQRTLHDHLIGTATTGKSNQVNLGF